MVPLETKVCRCNLDLGYIFDIQLIFHWCVLRWGSKSKHHKDTCVKEFGLRPQILVITPHLVANTIVYSIRKSTSMAL